MLIRIKHHDTGKVLFEIDPIATGYAISESWHPGWALGWAAEQAVVDRVSLAGADLRTAIFRNVDLSIGNFVSAHLERAQFFRCKLNDTNFTAAYLEGTKFHEVTSVHTTFHNANLTGADLKRSKFIACDFHHANLSWVNSQNNDFTSSRMMNVRLIGATMQGSQPGSMFLTTNLTDADLSYSRFTGRANFTDASLRNVKFDHADMEGVTYQNADLSGASFHHTSLRSANLTLANLFDTDFGDAHLWDIDIRNSNVTCIKQGARIWRFDGKHHTADDTLLNIKRPSDT